MPLSVQRRRLANGERRNGQGEGRGCASAVDLGGAGAENFSIRYGVGVITECWARVAAAGPRALLWRRRWGQDGAGVFFSFWEHSPFFCVSWKNLAFAVRIEATGWRYVLFGKGGRKGEKGVRRRIIMGRGRERRRGYYVITSDDNQRRVDWRFPDRLVSYPCATATRGRPREAEQEGRPRLQRLSQVPSTVPLSLQAADNSIQTRLGSDHFVAALLCLLPMGS